MKKKRRCVTMVEMLIVIALIGIIGGALAYNLGGGLRKGQEFRTEQGKKRLKNILYYEIYERMRDPAVVAESWIEYVEGSSLRDRSMPLEDIITDAYGQEYEVAFDEESGEIIVYSSRDRR